MPEAEASCCGVNLAGGQRGVGWLFLLLGGGGEGDARRCGVNLAGVRRGAGLLLLLEWRGGGFVVEGDGPR